MKNAEELESAVKNLNYYANKIQQLSADQFEYDVNNCQMILEATKRLDCLGAIGGNCEGIKLLCISIKVNIENAKKIKLPMDIKEE
jgi:hypothetical protein